MTFWTSYDTELDWDHLFVEAHTVGQDDWTTLPDVERPHEPGHRRELPETAAGATSTHSSTTTRPSTARRTCSPTGTTGAWNAGSRQLRGLAAVGRSTWPPTRASRSRSRSRYASDWATQGLGVFIDDIEVSTGEGTTSFETGLDGWDDPGPARRQRAEPATTSSRRPPAASPRAPWSPPPTPSTWASASRASPVPRPRPGHGTRDGLPAPIRPSGELGDPAN